MSCRNTILRVSEYRRILSKLKSLGFEQVFSDHLASALDISPALVRKDFSDFNLCGNRKSGYSVDYLIDKLNAILRKDKTEKVIVVGCGGIGRAMMHYNPFSGEGIRIVRGFDSNPGLHNNDPGIPVHDMSMLEYFISREKIKTAILAVPESSAADVANLLISLGIRGILNLSPVTLKEHDNCAIRNINFLHEMENVIYFSNVTQ